MQATRPVLPSVLWPVAAVAIAGILVLVSRWTGFLLPIGLGMGLSWIAVRYFRQPRPQNWLAVAIPASFHLAAIAFLAILLAGSSWTGWELAYLIGWVASLSLAGLVSVLTCWRASLMELGERRAARGAIAIGLAVYAAGVVLLWMNGGYIRQPGNEALPRIILPVLYLVVLGISAWAAWAFARRLGLPRTAPAEVVALGSVIAVLMGTFLYPVEFMNDCTGHSLLPYALC